MGAAGHPQQGLYDGDLEKLLFDTFCLYSIQKSSFEIYG